MKTTGHLILLILPLVFILSSCSSSNDVVGRGLFQKRKHNKGWHVNLKLREEASKTHLESRKQKAESKSFDLASIEPNELLKEEVQREASSQKRNFQKTQAKSFKKNQVLSVKKRLEKRTYRPNRNDLFSEKKSSSPKDKGIEEEESDDFFVYMSFGACVVGLLIGIYPFFGLLMGILALVFALIALGSGENAKLSSLAVLASIVLMVLASLYALIWVAIWTDRFLV